MMDSPQKQALLFVTNAPTDAHGLIDLLQPEWAVQTIPTERLSDHLAESARPPDLILFDLQQPNLEPPPFWDTLRASSKTQAIPVILIAASDDETIEATELKMGAVDFIQTPIRPHAFKARIRIHLARSLKTQELELLASRDPLTQLANRRTLDDSFAREIARAERYDRPFSILLLDIDHFKKVNDTFGHAVGDSVLAETGALLKTHLRQTDLLGRWGGDEFLILCPETDFDAANQLARRLLQTYENHSFQTAGRLTASLGVASHQKGSATKDLLLLADQALYRAKQQSITNTE